MSGSNSIFSPVVEGGDVGQSLVGQLSTSTNALLGETSGVRQAVLSMLSVYSTAILVVASFIVLYYVVYAVIDAAQTGKSFRRFTVWAPLRLVVAIGLLVPIPFGGASGLNSGQLLVIKVAEWGSGLASQAWEVAVQQPQLLKPLVATPTVPPATALVRSLVLQKACLELSARMAAEERQELARIARETQSPPAAPTLQPATKLTEVRNGDGSVTVPYGFPGRPYFCGSTTFYPPNSGEALAYREIKNAHTEAAREIDLDAQNVAGQMVAISYGDINARVFGVTDMAEKYSFIMKTALARLFDRQLDDLMMQEGAAPAEQGWIGSAVAVDEVLRLNVRLIALTASQPQLDPPDFFLSPPVARPWEDKLYTKLREIEAMWGNVPALSPFSAAGLGGLSAVLGQTISTSQTFTGPGRTAAQLRTARDLLRLDDHNWASLASRPPLAGLAEFGAYLSGKSAMILAGAGVLNVTGQVAAPTVSVLTLLAGLGFMVSLALLMLTPLIPFIRFMLGIAAWLIAIFEAVVAAPLVALMHLKADEDGLAGRSAVLCYVLVLQVAVRPVLMVFGLLGGLIIFLMVLAVLNALFSGILLGLTGAGQIGSMWFVLASLVYAVLALALANISFRLIDWLPERVMTWMSGLANAGTTGRGRPPEGGQNGAEGGGLTFGFGRRNNGESAPATPRYGYSNRSGEAPTAAAPPPPPPDKV